MADNVQAVNGLVTAVFKTTEESSVHTPHHTQKPFAVASKDWSYAAAASGIVNTTTAVAFKAAAGAGLKNYITAIQFSAEALGAATELVIRKGAGGTVLWRTKIGTGGLVNGREIVFPTPLPSDANQLLEVCTLTASVTGAVYFNAQGFVGA